MSKALEAASDRIREMIPQMSVWFPSMEQGDALARACVAAYLRAVGEVDGVIFKRAEARASLHRLTRCRPGLGGEGKAGRGAS